MRRSARSTCKGSGSASFADTRASTEDQGERGLRGSPSRFRPLDFARRDAVVARANGGVDRSSHSGSRASGWSQDKAASLVFAIPAPCVRGGPTPSPRASIPTPIYALTGIFHSPYIREVAFEASRTAKPTPGRTPPVLGIRWEGSASAPNATADCFKAPAVAARGRFGESRWTREAASVGGARNRFRRRIPAWSLSPGCSSTPSNATRQDMDPAGRGPNKGETR